MVGDRKVAEALKALRERLGLTQVQMAEKIEMSYPTIQRYEGRNPPTGAALLPFIRLAEELSEQQVGEILKRAAIASIPTELLALAAGHIEAKTSPIQGHTEIKVGQLTVTVDSEISDALVRISNNLGRPVQDVLDAALRYFCYAPANAGLITVSTGAYTQFTQIIQAIGRVENGLRDLTAELHTKLLAGSLDARDSESTATTLVAEELEDRPLPDRPAVPEDVPGELPDIAPPSARDHPRHPRKRH